MIILPNTPPTPKSSKFDLRLTDPKIVSKRIALDTQCIENQNQLISYISNLEDYIECIFSSIKSKIKSAKINEIIKFADSNVLIEGEEIPWTNISSNSDQSKMSNVPDSISRIINSWSLLKEIEAVIISISFAYVRLGSELINELIELDSNTEVDNDLNEHWKQSINHFKKAISFAKFGTILGRLGSISQIHFSDITYLLISKIGHTCVQMSILSKSSWINRITFNSKDSIESRNNGSLARVAIYVVNEIKFCKNLLNDLQVESNSLRLNCIHWNEYFNIVEKYARSYAGLFFSIENYQKDKLGYAIGLINFSLLSLQSKKFSDINPKEGKLLTKFKHKISSKKNESYISNLNSITTLKIDKSVFGDRSGVVLKDLTYLFDQLIQLHLKFTKENNNLKFDKVTDFKDINKDSKWPLGSKIPISDIEPFNPLDASEFREPQLESYLGKGAYY